MPRFVPDFLKRIKDQALDSAQNRIRRELAPNVPDYEPEEPPGGPEEVEPGFGQRIKNQVKKRVNNLSPIQRMMLDPNHPIDQPTIKYRIKYAGERNLLVYLYYNGQWRHVEPYSYRYRGRGPNGKPAKKLLFFGYCRIHGKIHAFKPDKIGGLIVTNETYSPRWPVQLSHY